MCTSPAVIFTRHIALKYRSTETLPKIAQNFSFDKSLSRRFRSRNGMGLFELTVRDVSKAIVTGRETGRKGVCHICVTDGSG
jgi:hypothetical protein